MCTMESEVSRVFQLDMMESVFQNISQYPDVVELEELCERLQLPIEKICVCIAPICSLFSSLKSTPSQRQHFS